MTCTGRHTKLQFTVGSRKCPKCKAPEDCFVTFSRKDGNCEMLHIDDGLECHRCGYEATGAEFEALYNKQRNEIVCPHCNGTGKVEKGKNG